MKLLTFYLAVPALILVTGAAGAAVEDDLQALLAGVEQIAAPGWPGTLCVYGENAFTLVAGNASSSIRQPVAAAARYGRGRIVAFGHNGYFGRESLEVGETGRLMLNAARWLSGKQQPRVGVQNLPDMVALFRREGMEVQPIDGADWTRELSDIDVLVTIAAPAYNSAEATAVRRFIREGGGFLAGDCPWGWLQLNPGKSLTREHGGNQVLAPAGLVWADGGLGRTSELGFAADREPSPFIHAGLALDAIEAQQGGERRLSPEETAQAAWSITHAARSLMPDDRTLRPRLKRLQEEYAGEAVPGPDQPLKMDQALARLALTLELEEIKNLPPDRVKAHPSADLFPGAVPADAPRVMRTLAIDTSVSGWHSTGLYAAPGETIDVSVPDDAVGRGLQVRIGCHTDGLWHHDAWRRAPEISRAFALDQVATLAANAFGGLVYIEAPAECPLGDIEVKVKGAVEAPHFVLGRTTPEEWSETIRSYPAPWAELESSRVILSVPSVDIRGLDNPVELMEFWVSVLDACNQLLARPLERSRPERYVADVQISAGYMHSGYPIMTHLDAAQYAVDLQRLVSQGTWGHFHEMGHNHQSGDWTFGGTGEVTCNLFSLYLSERCCALTGPAHPAVAPETREKKTREHLAAGAPFDRWRSDPFLALYMYMQLQEAFGWEAYKQVFAEYNQLSDDERPRNDDEKRDRWLVTFSRVVDRNLGPFYQAWGVPTSEAARAQIAALPVWMPPGFAASGSSAE